MPDLPNIMVAPTGARRTRADHPALPITIPEIVATARDCHAAGAGGIHAHVRDGAERHTLDAGLYRELLAELAAAVPDMVVQITTEAVGRYSPEDQRNLVRELRPEHVSVALREMVAGQDERDIREFYHWAHGAGITIQHILYSPREVRLFEEFVARGVIPSDGLELIFVLGQYGGHRDSLPGDIARYIHARAGAIADADWAVCAFGRHETDCLLHAVRAGGKARIGFENNLLNSDGSIASGNAERVAELVAGIGGEQRGRERREHGARPGARSAASRC